MSSNELLEELEITQTGERADELCLELRRLDRSASDRVGFSASVPGGPVRISVGKEVYLTEIEGKATMAAPGFPPAFGITVLTGKMSGRQAGGSVLIAVNCGQEPPTLQIAARLASGPVHSWSWAIDHNIQHRILRFFTEAT